MSNIIIRECEICKENSVKNCYKKELDKISTSSFVTINIDNISNNPLAIGCEIIEANNIIIKKYGKEIYCAICNSLIYKATN